MPQRFPALQPVERWTRAQLVDYLYNCLLPEFRDENLIYADPADGIGPAQRSWYAKAFVAEIDEQPAERLVALCRSAAAPRKVSRRRWWDQLDLGLEIEVSAPLTRRQRWQLFQLLTQQRKPPSSAPAGASKRVEFSPASQAQTRSSGAFASASLSA